jgi:hypothetical protein
MICELCLVQENLDLRKGKKLIIVGVCGGCHEATLCHECIDKHQESCIGWQMHIKDQHILQ